VRHEAKTFTCVTASLWYSSDVQNDRPVDVCIDPTHTQPEHFYLFWGNPEDAACTRLRNRQRSWNRSVACFRGNAGPCCTGSQNNYTWRLPSSIFNTCSIVQSSVMLQNAYLNVCLFVNVFPQNIADYSAALRTFMYLYLRIRECRRLCFDRCIFICMCVIRITQQLLNRIAWNLLGWLVIIRGPFDKILGSIGSQSRSWKGTKKVAAAKVCALPSARSSLNMFL